MGSVDGERRGLWRSRWAAIGAAVAVTLGGGGFFAVQAASSVPSSVVTIDPVRILDTRTDVGLAGPFVSPVSQKLQVTGGAVPSGATGVLLNVTAVQPQAAGFVSIRPGDATGAPTTSSLNVDAGQTVPNSVQVGLPTSGANAGQIDITYDAYGQAGPSTEMLIDVVGYMVAGGGGTDLPVLLAPPGLLVPPGRTARRELLDPWSGRCWSRRACWSRGSNGATGAVGPIGPAGPAGPSIGSVEHTYVHELQFPQRHALDGGVGLCGLSRDWERRRDRDRESERRCRIGELPHQPVFRREHLSITVVLWFRGTHPGIHRLVQPDLLSTLSAQQ